MKSRTRLIGAAGGMTALGMLAVQTVGGFEGLRLYAYKDVVGVWTACYGSIVGIKPGMKFSVEDCNNLLVKDLVKHEAGMRACMSAPDDLPVNVYVADLSLAFNVGVGAFCKSTVNKLQKAGKLRESCEAFMRFVYAGGKVIPGLVKRREKERALCLKGVA
jgi:lysozyme